MAFWRSKKNDSSDESTTPASPSAGDEAAAGPESSTGPESSGGLFGKMKNGLQKTRRVLGTDIRDLFKA
ncbi:MAG: signal recognition particle-docking protein FtsY, partial [Rhodopirellula bahusiensis]